MKNQIILIVTLMLVSIFYNPNDSYAHCDSIEGPVVVAAKKALQTGNVNHVLLWVGADDEAEIKDMFDKVNKVRKINDDVRDLADMYFFETLVRVHRMGEGVGYTGLKQQDFNPAEGIEAADIAIAKNSVNHILAHVDGAEHEKVKHYFSDLQSKRNYEVNDLHAAREYVKSYVHFIHYVEGLFGGENLHDDHSHQEHNH